jgi:hypothetical protein
MPRPPPVGGVLASRVFILWGPQDNAVDPLTGLQGSDLILQGPDIGVARVKLKITVCPNSVELQPTVQLESS